ncbi:helix-turn-helix domain-containing protein [Candidatus Soleaferrea massiliensis]|uniref:helix-turn-helix domain-containing protein n=1 Tax=Candidatus Soleaferrea massiliensis TaxID=1470354 RepID=UPI00059103D5|nr:helix-turn-helix transcriptional regulator [Candidatus Soleaferrea massiliensis]
MNADFPRILTLLRKEKGISQKQAASELQISQALLSHYEKGIRECGLEFLTRAADFYGVSCDYLLGRSPDRHGMMLQIEDIPEPDSMGKESTFRGSILPTLNKKLISNSLNILFDLMQRCNNKALTTEMSAYLMLAVYRMFRILYCANPKNQRNLFTIPSQFSAGYTAAAMQFCASDAQAVADSLSFKEKAPSESLQGLAMTTESLSKDYPLFASSLLNLLQNAEHKVLDYRK